MATNDDVQAFFTDALIRRQIYLQGYSTNLSNQIAALLDDTEADVERAIRERLGKIAGMGVLDLGPSTTAKLKTLRAAIGELRGAGFADAADLWDDQLRKISVSEGAATQNGLQDAGDSVTPNIVFESIIPSAEKLAALVSIKPFEGKLMREWAKYMASNDLDRIMNSITIGLTRGETIDQIVRRVLGSGAVNGRDGILELTRRNLAAVTKTAVSTLTNAARRVYFQANEDIFQEEAFVATLDSHTTAICRATDGTVSPVGEGPQPPLHWGCRSIVVALIGDHLAGKRPANGDEVTRVDAKTTYAEFLSRQSPEFQDEVLGASKGKLFRDGGLTLDKFVARDGHEYTLDELQSREPKAFKRAGV